MKTPVLSFKSHIIHMADDLVTEFGIDKSLSRIHRFLGIPNLGFIKLDLKVFQYQGCSKFGLKIHSQYLKPQCGSIYWIKFHF